MAKQGLILTQKLQNRLSPHQIQFIKLLSLDVSDLEEKIKEEMEKNPALVKEDMMDRKGNIPDDNLNEVNFDEQSVQMTETFTLTGEHPEGEFQEVSMEELHQRDDDAPGNDYDVKMALPDESNDDRYESPIIQRRSLYDLLIDQLELLEMDAEEHTIAEYIVGNVNEDGYLRRIRLNDDGTIDKVITGEELTVQIKEELAFYRGVYVDNQKVEQVIKKLQQLEPAGVFARDLRECLIIQLKRKEKNPLSETAIKIIENHFDAFTSKNYDRLKNKYNLDDAKLRAIIDLIHRLNPKPGESESDPKTRVIVPDFILTTDETTGKISIKLNHRNTPELMVDKEFSQMMKELEKSKSAKSDFDFVKKRVDEAKWFIDALRQRQHTLLKTMGAIVSKQLDFFRSEGDVLKLKPMILQDVADDIQMDVSTVSRVSSTKYVQTDFGIYPLSFFFSEGIKKREANGESVWVSNKEVRQVLKNILEEEDKTNPYSDDKLTELLNEKGYEIARRTVAKYREKMGIPAAGQRKEKS
jgi:RNA polymerase sigma-54 factor